MDEEKDTAADIENIISEFCDGTLVPAPDSMVLMFSLEHAHFSDFDEGAPQKLADRIAEYIEKLTR